MKLFQIPLLWHSNTNNKNKKGWTIDFIYCRFHFTSIIIKLYFRRYPKSITHPPESPISAVKLLLFILPSDTNTHTLSYSLKGNHFRLSTQQKLRMWISDNPQDINREWLHSAPRIYNSTILLYDCAKLWHTAAFMQCERERESLTLIFNCAEPNGDRVVCHMPDILLYFSTESEQPMERLMTQFLCADTNEKSSLTIVPLHLIESMM